MTTYQSQSTRVRQLFSTLAAVTASNPVLLEGEKWNEKDATTGRATGRSKTGDGAVSGAVPNQTITGTAFNDLPFDPGTGGASLSDATPQALGTAAAGTASTGSRSDHRHAMPTATQVGADATGTASAAVAAHVALADPHPVYTTAAEAAAAAPVQSVAGRTGAVTLAVADVSGAVSSSDSRLSDPRTPTAHTQAFSTITGTPTTLSGYGVTDAVGSSDSRLSDAREWSAATATQAEVEAGSSTTRLAFTPQRVFQAIAAWWAASASKIKLDGIAAGATANSSDATLLARANHTGTQAASTITGLATVATSGAYADLSGRPTLGTAAAAASTAFAASGAVTGSGLTVTSSRVIGRSTAGTGAPEEFALLGLAFNGTNLATLADLVIPLSDETTALTASSSVAKLTIPYWPRATVLTDLPIWAVATAPTGAALQFDIQVGGTSIYLPASSGSYPTIAISGTNSTASAGAFTTAFAAAPTIAVGSVVTFFVRQIGSTVAGAGLKVALLTRRAG